MSRKGVVKTRFWTDCRQLGSYLQTAFWEAGALPSHLSAYDYSAPNNPADAPTHSMFRL